MCLVGFHGMISGLSSFREPSQPEVRKPRRMLLVFHVSLRRVLSNLREPKAGMYTRVLFHGGADAAGKSTPMLRNRSVQFVKPKGTVPTRPQLVPDRAHNQTL